MRLKLLFFFFFILTASFISLKNYGENYIKSPLNINGKEMIFTIDKGQSFRHIAERLEEEGLIEKAFLFRLYARFKKADKAVHQGEYLLSPAKSPEDILDSLLKGKIRLYKITIPEGLRLEEIAKRVEESGLISREEFLRAAKEDNCGQSFDIREESLEGYLFPDTYLFPRNVIAKDMVCAMLKPLKELYTKERAERAKELGLSLHELITFASIIEKESSLKEERPLVSSVFHNRLKKNMRLQTDPTVIYGMKDYQGRIRKKDLKDPHPYNTYIIKGLPPGPIASPGRSSIEAALWPAESPYLFFVSKNDGSHYFSSNLKDHEAAVKKYQLSGRKK